MLVENSPLAEMSAAVDASVGFFVCVDSEVLGEVALLPESLTTVVARVRTGFNVYAPVLE